MLIQKPSKELAMLLQTKVMLERANTEIITRIDGNLIAQFNIISNSKNQFLLNYGPAISGYDDWEFSLTQDQAFSALAEVIKAHGDRIKFNLLMLPPGKQVEHSLIDLNNDVLIRVIEYYEIRLDEILTRYDVIVEKVIKNA